MTKHLLEQTVEQRVHPKSNPVPSRTSKGSLPLDSSSLKPAVTKPLKVYATVGEELAAIQKRIVTDWYEDELRRLRDEMRRVFEIRKGRLESMRDRQYREVNRDCGVES